MLLVKYIVVGHVVWFNNILLPYYRVVVFSSKACLLYPDRHGAGGGPEVRQDIQVQYKYWVPAGLQHLLRYSRMTLETIYIVRHGNHSQTYLTGRPMVDQSAGFRVHWVTNEWLVSESRGISYHIHTAQIQYNAD